MLCSFGKFLPKALTNSGKSCIIKAALRFSSSFVFGRRIFRIGGFLGKLNFPEREFCQPHEGCLRETFYIG